MPLAATGNQAAAFAQTKALWAARVATACWGDSLTSGVGASAAASYPSVLGTLDPGRPVFNGGVAGEDATQIVDRLVADAVHRDWVCLLWIGRNNAGAPGGVNALRDLVMPEIARAVAQLTRPEFLVLTILNKGGSDTSEQFGTSIYDQIIAANAAILSTYPNNSEDIRSHLVANSTGAAGTDCIGTSFMPSDPPHMNAAGYAAVSARAWNALNSKGW